MRGRLRGRGRAFAATSPRIRAFSLVEIVLAIGVASVALVSVIGLLGVAANTTQLASRDTVLAAISTQVMNDLRAAPFDALWTAEPRKGKSDPALSTGSPVASTYFFTNEGVRLDAAKVAGNFDATYECEVTKTPDEATKTADGGPYNQLKLNLVVTWPVSVPRAKRETRTIYASIARY